MTVSASARSAAASRSSAVSGNDEQVAARVAAWERDNGLPVRDWRAIGRAEGRDGSEIR
jgi:hypothetical protein